MTSEKPYVARTFAYEEKPTVAQLRVNIQRAYDQILEHCKTHGLEPVKKIHKHEIEKCGRVTYQTVKVEVKSIFRR